MKNEMPGFALMLAAALASAPADAGVEKLESCGQKWFPTQMDVGRGVLNDVTVTGFGVDLATSVDTSLPGTQVSILSRKNGPGSNIVIRLSAPAAGDPVEGDVKLHYFGGGLDSFGARLSAGPTVTSIAFAPGAGVSTSGGTIRVTSLEPHVVILRGTNLNHLRTSSYLTDDRFLRLTGLREARIVLQVPNELHLSFKPESGERAVSTPLFVLNETAICGEKLPEFSLTFTAFDPPRTPTPTPTPLPPSADLKRPVAVGPGAGLTLQPSPTPTPNRACLDQKSRETAQLAADAARCGDTPACVQIRKNEQKAIEDRYQSCLSRGGK
jgi:hypothetical protein